MCLPHLPTRPISNTYPQVDKIGHRVVQNHHYDLLYDILRGLPVLPDRVDCESLSDIFSYYTEFLAPPTIDTQPTNVRSQQKFYPQTEIVYHLFLQLSYPIAESLF